MSLLHPTWASFSTWPRIIGVAAPYHRVGQYVTFKFQYTQCCCTRMQQLIYGYNCLLIHGLHCGFKDQLTPRHKNKRLNVRYVSRYKTGEELVSHDPKCNVFNYKHTYSVEIVPICKDEVVCLPPKLAQHLGNIGQLCVVYRVTQAIHIIDPNTCQSELSWQHFIWTSGIMPPLDIDIGFRQALNLIGPNSRPWSRWILQSSFEKS